MNGFGAVLMAALASGAMTTFAGAGTARANPVAPLAHPCSELVPNVYVAPAKLAASTLGEIVRCAPDTAMTNTVLATRLALAGVIGVPVTSGAQTYRIAYRTTRSGGAAGMSSARVFLPTAPKSGPLPVIVFAHGTAGLADLCAPTLSETYFDYAALPWVARGYPVIATDYAGLGTDGTQGYVDTADTAYSTLDAARALRRLLPASALSSKVVILGHSQGGGAALGAQALARVYGAGGALAGVVAFAPGGFSIQPNIDFLRNPALPTLALGVHASTSALRVEAYFANKLGVAHALDGFAPTSQALVGGVVASQCMPALISSIPVAAPTVGALFSNTFRASTIACFDQAQCVEPGKGFVAHIRRNVLNADPNGGKVLMMLGANDTLLPTQEARCQVDKLKANGQPPTVCLDPLASHFDVAARGTPFVVSWVEALLAENALPTCTATQSPDVLGSCVLGGATN